MCIADEGAPLVYRDVVIRLDEVAAVCIADEGAPLVYRDVVIHT